MRPILVILIVLASLPLSACATDEHASRPAYVVVEENASINDRRDIRRTSILDDDVLLIEARPGGFYRVDLIGPCVSLADAMTPVRIEDTGIGVDRTTRFHVGGRTCVVRSVSRVERAPPAAG
jgi:hypothetical protein